MSEAENLYAGNVSNSVEKVRQQILAAMIQRCTALKSKNDAACAARLSHCYQKSSETIVHGSFSTEF